MKKLFLIACIIFISINSYATIQTKYYLQKDSLDDATSLQFSDLIKKSEVTKSTKYYKVLLKDKLITSYSYHVSDKLIYSAEIKYEENLKIQETYYSSKGEVLFSWIYKYNNDKQLTYVLKVDKNNSAKEEWILQYNEEKKLTQKTQLKEEKTVQIIKWYYDKKGNPIKIEIIKNEKVVKKWEMSYYDNNQLEISIRYENEKLVFKSYFDKKGRNTKSEFYTDNKITSYWQNSYYSNGTIKEKKFVENMKTQFVLYYNSDGDLIRKDIYKNGQFFKSQFPTKSLEKYFK